MDIFIWKKNYILNWLLNLLLKSNVREKNILQIY